MDPKMSMRDEAGLGLAVHWVQQVLTSAYKDNCPLRPARKGKKSLRWTPELESLRREVRQLFNRCQANSNSHSCELYREAQRDIGRRYERLPKRLGGLSVAP
jgi:hypothetical protein